MKLKLALMAVAIAATSTAMAADKRTSISVFGNLSKQSTGDASGTVFLSFGRLVTDSLELEVSLAESFSSGDTTTMLGGGVKYYFGAVGKAGAVVPYVRAGLQSASSSGGGARTSIIQAGGGVEFTMSESAATFVEAAYARYSTGNFTDNGVQVNVGIKLRF